jgi:hypothetical protein
VPRGSRMENPKGRKNLDHLSHSGQPQGKGEAMDSEKPLGLDSHGASAAADMLGYRASGPVCPPVQGPSIRNALKSGLNVEEMFHAPILAVTTIGCPTVYAAMTWIDDAVGGSGPPTGSG